MIEPRAVAVVGMGAILPDAFDVQTFWRNILSARYSIKDVDPNRWDPDLYYSPDPTVVDKTYSKIGGWVRGFHFEPMKAGIAIPPRVLDTIDEAQQWAIATSLQAMVDYGYPKRQYDPNRVAVILGNAMAGEHHYLSTLRIHLPDFQQALRLSPAFQTLPLEVQKALLFDMGAGIHAKIPAITEDTMPGELSNIIAGRVANVFNFGGPNFVTDAACASSLAAVQAAIEGLVNRQYDLVLTGGVDRNMGAESFVKFSKIGALSPDGSRPYADGANGFVMGEGAVIFMLKRLAEAEQDGDKIYAVIRGIGSSSDGKGKGITAPNPAGQIRSIERAWKNAGVSPSSVGLVEGHGTSTKVGDFAELTSLNSVFGQYGIPTGRVGLGSVKSNFGHLKSAAGAAGMLKVIMALNEKILPPSVNFTRPNPQIDFAHLPFAVVTEQRPWPRPEGEIRRGCVSSFGFGGTNFHMVIEEHIPGLLTSDSRSFPGVEIKSAAALPQPAFAQPLAAEGDRINLAAYGGLVFLNAHNADELKQRLATVIAEAKTGVLPATEAPSPEALGLPERLAIEYTGAEELIKRAEKALKAFDNPAPNAWQPLTAQGIYRGSGKPGKVAFLFPGQGSQYVNMLRELCNFEPVVANTFREADEVMTPILGKPLTSFIFVEGDEASLAKAEVDLRNTTITQPAMLAANIALLRLMKKFGFKPDMVIGHSLGEYAALVAAGVLSFADALRVVSARGREMAKVSWEDNGCMAAVSGPLKDVENILNTIDGYVVIANINSPVQSVIGGATKAVEAAIAAFQAAGMQAQKIPVSHAFHTKIVAPASGPLRQIIAGMNVQTPQLLIVANVTGEVYPTSREEILNLLADQVASPVQMVKSMQTLYREGARIFVEIGPKRVLNSLACDNLKDHSDVTVLATNHPRKGALITFKEALCGLYAAGVNGVQLQPAQPLAVAGIMQTVHVTGPSALAAASDGRQPLTGSVVVSGAGLGLPGRQKHVFDDRNVQSLLHGDLLIEPLPVETRNRMLEKRVTRLNKSEAGATMVDIDDLEQTIKLAGQRGDFNLVEEFGLSAERVEALDISTQLAIAAGVEALRDAGIPLVMTYRQTSKGTYLPNRWMLPEALADETGVVFASAFPGLQRMSDEADRFYEYKNLSSQVEEMRNLLALVPASQSELFSTLTGRIASLEARLAEIDYHFDRRFIFRVLAMGHSQFAEYIGARGPNTHVNAACASTTHAVAIAEDWIRAGRCRRVVVIAGDDVTSGNLASWVGTGMLASGASTTEGDPRQAILPFDRRRNGLIIGMGAAALVIEAEDAVRERGMRGICEVLASQIANSAFHGTRLDVSHVALVMEHLVAQAEQRFGLNRSEIAAKTVFVSHETYTPARGGSAAAEIRALRQTFNDQASKVVIANTKGFTGHSMGVGVEDVLAVKALEFSTVPPIANIHEGFEPDPELGDLNLSQGGHYPVEYALRLGAGFGSQIAMTLFRKIPGVAERINHPVYDRWLGEVAGYAKAELEVVQHTLRIRHSGPPTQSPAKSTWQLGQGPTAWAAQIDTPAAAALAQPVPAAATVAARIPEPVSVAVPAPAASSVAEADIKAFILAVTSEKTGYPAEMLDLDLDLEADLGIDTVKQAELFATIRTHYGIPRRDDLRLSDYNTLTKVIGFVKDGTAGQTTAAPAAQPVPAVQPAVKLAEAPANRPATAEIKAFILAVTSEKTGYPSEMLDLDLDLEADLGIDTVKQAELFATIRTNYGIPRREDLRLSDYNTLTKVIKFVEDALPAVTGAAQPDKPAEIQPPAREAAIAQAPAAPSVSLATSTAEIKTYVLAVVSEKTGYPAEMLDLDLDLEADLGIDTVKQAELFATIRSNYGIPRREDLRLSDYNNLTKVIKFVEDALSSAAPAEPIAKPVEVQQPTPAVVEVSAASSSAASDDAIKAFVLAVVSEKTGYPAEMLDLDLDLEADLGIDTVKQAELFATIRTHYGIPRREDLRLSDYNNLNKVIQFVKNSLTGGLPVAVSEASPSEQASVPQAAPAAEQTQASPVTASPSPDYEAVKTHVLALVSEKTGYPPEMLDLDLDLEADLGIDTVKQAELFAAIRTHYGIPRREDLRLSDYNNLAKVIQFVLEPNPAVAQSVEPAPAAQPVAEAAPVPAPVVEIPQPAAPAAVEVLAAPLAAEAAVQAVVTPEVVAQPEEKTEKKIQRRIPVPVLRPRLDLCTPTSVTLEAGLRVLVVNDQGDTGKSLARRLRSRKVQVLSLDNLSTAESSEKLAKYLEEGPINGVYFLPALDVEPLLAETTAEQWQEEMGRRVYALFNLMKAIPGEPFLVSATRMGGLHGYTSQGATAPMGGAVSGFTKALALERPDSFAKVVDFASGVSAATVAGHLIEETLSDPGVVEVGWEDDRRFSIALIEKDLPSQKLEFPDKTSVFLVTGGSGGIIAPVVTDMAKNCGGTYYLVGVEHLPERDDRDLPRLKNDRNALKKDLMARLSTPDNKATPAQVDQRLNMLDRCAATLETLDKVTGAGGTAHYIFCDVTKPESVSSLVDQILEKEGHVDVLLHAAGLERSRKLENKPFEEFKLILSVKADGFFNLYRAFMERNSLPPSIMGFTSIAGRFGNSGQTDYSAANDFLCKVFSALAFQHPGTRTQVLDWGAWADVGMASRGYIPALMERAGIDMLKPEAAAPLVLQELQHNPGSGEAVLAGSLGVMAKSRHENGGLDLALANKALTDGTPIHVMLSRATGFDLQQGILLEADLDPQIEPFLKDHSMNGIPLLPGVMGIEGFSVAAKHVSSVLGSGKAGYEVTNLEDVSFLTPFKFYRGEPRRITWKAQVLRESNGLVAHVTLESDLALKTNRVEHKVHFSGKVHLEPLHSQKEMTATPPEWNGAYTVNAEEIYRLYFHGPAFQVLDGVQLSGNTVLGKLRSHLPPFTSGGLELLSTPVLVELCLQTAGIWEAGKTGTLCLPSSIGFIRLYNSKVDGIPVYAEVTPSKDADGRMCFDARVIDAKGHLFLEISDYRTSPLPYTVEDNILAPMQALVAEK
jgi:malonyl CoA-acyl carrier protein transacylase